MARDVTLVQRLVDALATSVPADDPAAVTVESPAGAIALREVVAGELGASSRRLLAVVLGVAGLTLVTALLGAVGPAIAAALRDPMRILRVP